MFKEIENDSLIYGIPDFVAGNNLIVSTNVQSLSPYLTGRNNLAITSLEKLSVVGDLSWDISSENGHNFH